jgi:hypothetical protein
VMSFVRKHPVVVFFALAYGLSWAYWLLLATAGTRIGPGSSSTHFPGLLGPAVAAFTVTGLTDGKRGIVALARRCVLVSRPTGVCGCMHSAPFCSFSRRCSRQARRAWSCRRSPTLRCTRVCRHSGFLSSWARHRVQRLRGRNWAARFRASAATAAVWAGWRHIPARGAMGDVAHADVLRR